MKKYLLSLTFSLFVLCMRAQIPNAGFETWSNGLPGQYITSYISNVLSGYPSNVTQSSDSHSGTSAIKLETAIYKNPSTNLNDTVPGFAVTGAIKGTNITTGFPFTGRPTSLSGYYKSTIPTGDTAAVVASLYKYNSSTKQRDSLGAAIFYIKTSVANYTMFTANFYYTSSLVNPDSAVIEMASSTNYSIPGSVLFVDDLTFNGVTATSTPLFSNFTPAFPNPAKDQLNLNNIPSSASQIDIMDMTGKVVEQISASSNIEVNLNNYPAGMYYYAIKNKDSALLYSDKFIVIK